MTRITRGGRTWCAALGAGALLAGCGGGPATEAETGEGGETAAAEFSITADEKGVAQLEAPASLTAGATELTLTNEGQAPAGLQLIAVDGDHDEEETVAELETAMDGEPYADWFHPAGGVGMIGPGQTGSVTQILEPGTYYAFAESEEGGDPADTFTEIEVEEDGGSQELPAADATISADEYSFEAEGLAGGEQRVLFDNVGEEPHHALAFPLAEGKTAEDLAAFFEDEQGPPPFAPEGIRGTSVIEGGKAQVVELGLESGRYGLVCFVSDREGGPPHAKLGMIQEVEVE